MGFAFVPRQGFDGVVGAMVGQLNNGQKFQKGFINRAEFFGAETIKIDESSHVVLEFGAKGAHGLQKGEVGAAGVV